MQFNFADFIPQFIRTVRTFRPAALFVRQHRLWEGFWNYGWVSRFLILVGIVMGLKFLSVFVDWIDKVRHIDSSNMMMVMSGMVTDIYKEGYAELFDGSMKYVMLILLEVIVFHVCRRTLEVLHGNLPDPKLKDFVRAQVRMLKVGIYSFVMETIIITIIGIPLEMMGVWALLKTPLKFIIECYFLGFAIVDNYNEQFHLSIKESGKYTQRYAGVALAVGIVLYVLMLVPIAGALIGPILTGVTATLVMHKISDLHLTRREELNHLASDEDAEHPTSQEELETV